MNQFGKEAEDRLLGHIRQAQGLVMDGLHPTQAIAKVASDNRVEADMIPLMVQAYNTGRQGFQREKAAGKGILAKIAEFPIANLEEVMREVYPQTPELPLATFSKTAVDRSYSQPPLPLRHQVKAARLKLASAKLPSLSKLGTTRQGGDPMIKMAKAHGRAVKEARNLDEIRYQAVLARDRLLSAMGKMADYFKQAEYNRIPLAEAEYNSVRLFGASARDCFDYIAIRNHTKEARAAGPPRLARPAFEDQVPYSLVKAALGAGADLLAAQRAHINAEREAATKIAELISPFDQPPSLRLTHVLDRNGRTFSNGQTKSAVGSLGKGFLGSLLGGAMGAAKAEKFVEPSKDLASDAESKFNDPQHMDELRQIQSRATLTDMLTNDEVISGYDPETVSEAYNEIVKLNPSASMQPMLLRPLLRKRLASGSMEPFEAQQMIEAEKGIRQTEDFARRGVPHAIRGSQALDQSGSAARA